MKRKLFLVLDVIIQLTSSGEFCGYSRGDMMASFEWCGSNREHWQEVAQSITGRVLRPAMVYLKKLTDTTFWINGISVDEVSQEPYRHQKVVQSMHLSVMIVWFHKRHSALQDCWCLTHCDAHNTTDVDQYAAKPVSYYIILWHIGKQETGSW